MNLAVIGINHKESPIEIREKFSLTESMKIESGNLLLDKSINEVVIVSTCNRSEIYIASENIDESIEKVRTFFKDYFNFEEAEKYMFTKIDKDVVIHLFMVAAGLDSMILGEDQILGQIKDAILFSIDLGFSKKILNKLFMEALTVGKKIRTELKISEIPLSTSYIGISMLRKEANGFNGKKALIVGAGKMSSLAIKYLSEDNLDKIYVTNRTHGRLKDIFDKFENITLVDYDNRYEILKEVDLLITATASPHTVIKKDNLIGTKEKLYILDLALPRDVDWRLSQDEKIVLYDNDDLQKLSEENFVRRKELSKKAEEMVGEDLEKYLKWLDTIHVDPVIASLNQRCIKIKEDTMSYINRRVDLNKRDTKVIDKMIMSALKQFIREPIKVLKEVDKENSEEYIDTLKKIFEI